MRGWKRWVPGKYLLDVVVGALIVLVVSPLLAVVAILIRMDSEGPVFYRQARVGRGGQVFRVFKFRTMVEGAEHIGLGREVARDDERITRVGKWLRTASIDEVPQLLNVVLGHMSLIGPRPGTTRHADMYTDHQRRRLQVKPGITGWAQVNGRNSLSWEDRIELDIWYIDHWSPWLDLRIIARTPLAVFQTADLYGPGGVTTDLGESAQNGEE